MVRVILIALVILIVIVSIAMTNKKRPRGTESLRAKDSEPMKEEQESVISSSLDLIVFISKPGSDFKEKWIDELAKYDLVVEIHPEFDIDNQSGFLPYKLKVPVGSKHIESEKYQGKTLLTGFELDISPFKYDEFFQYSSEEEMDKLPDDYKTKMKNCDLNFMIEVKASQNTSEYRMAWFAAATLISLFDGILTDPHTGINYEGKDAINKAIEMSNKFEGSLPDAAWKLHDFDQNW